MPDAGWEGIRNEKVSVGNMMMDGKNNENSILSHLLEIWRNYSSVYCVDGVSDESYGNVLIFGFLR